MVSSFDDVYQQALDDAADQVRAPQGVRRMGVNFARDAGIMGGIAAPSEDDQEMRASLTRFTSRPNSLRGLFHQLTGNVDAAQEQYRRVDEINARADALDSNVDTDLRNARSVGDVAAGVRKLLIQSGPDMALGGLAGGLGRAGARRAAIGAEAKALARNPSQELAQAAAKARPGAAAATPEVAALQRQEALQKAARAAVRGDKDAMARVDRAGRVGGFTAGTAGMVPGLLAEQNEFLQEHTGQADAAKVLAAATGAAALEYLPLDRLMGRAFKNPALKQAFLESNPSLGRQLARRAGTAVKNTAGQAVTEGGTEAGQAFLQRAGQKWIDNNVHLLSPEALDDYLVNFVAGTAVGTAMGGAVDGTQAVAGGTADTARWAWDRSGALREQVRANLAKPWFRGQQDGPQRVRAGEPMGPSGAGSGGEGLTASDILQRVQGSLRTAGERVGPLVDKARSTAADAFQRASAALRTNDDLDARADAVMDRMTAVMNDEADSGVPTGLRPGMIPGDGQFLRNWALSKVNPDYLTELGDSAAGHLGNALNHLAQGARLTIPQRSLVVQAINAGALSSADFDTVRAVGPTMLKRMNAMSRTAGDELGTLKSPQFGQQGNARAVIDEDGNEAVDTGVEEIVGLNEQRGDRELSALDRANSARQGMRAARERGDEARAQEQRAEGVAAFNEAREKLLGGLTTEENRSSTKAAQHYDNRKSQPGFVELADKVDKSDGRGKVMRGQLVNLAMLIKRQQDAMRREGSVAEDIKPRDALLRGLSELAQAGAAINPDTLTKGDIVAEYKNKAGEKTRDGEHIMYLSAKDIAAIKGELNKLIGPARDPSNARSLPTSRLQDKPRDRKIDKHRGTPGAEASHRLDKDFASATRYENEANPEPITAADADRGVLRARDTPPGEDMGGGTFTPSNSPVSSVSFDTRYQKDLNEWRKQRRLAGDDQAKLVAINQHFGQKIGAEELARESEAGTINPARLESELARLKDPASGLAERYLERAARGKLPGGETTASVRHMPYDNEAPAKGEKNDSWETQVDDEGEYRGEDADLRKRADKNRRTAKTLVKKSHPQADEQHKKNKKRLTLSKAREGASPEVSTGDGLGQAKKQLQMSREAQHAASLDMADALAAAAKKLRDGGLDTSIAARLEKRAAEIRVSASKAAPAKPDPVKPKGQVGQRRVVKKAEVADQDLDALDAARTLISSVEGRAYAAAEAAAKSKYGQAVDMAKVSVTDAGLNALYEAKIEELDADGRYSKAKTLVEASDKEAADANRRKAAKAYAERSAAERESASRGRRPDTKGVEEHVRINDKVIREAYEMTERQLLAEINRTQRRYDNTPASAGARTDPRSFIAMDLDSLRRVYRERFGKKAEAANEDLDGAIESTAKSKSGQHDHKRESWLATAILRALGYTADQIPLLKVNNKTKGPLSGRHDPYDGTIGLGDALQGEERMEVLSHEIGHAVVAAEIAKAFGVPVKGLRDAHGQVIQPEMWPQMLKQANPELYAALKADFDKWRAQNDLGTNYNQMRSTRSGPHRVRNEKARTVAQGRDGMTVGDRGMAEYDLSMNEWLADNIGRALLQNKRGSSIVEKFFADIANALKQAYQILFGSEKGAKYAPAPSVKAWVDGMFDAQIAATKGATGQSVPKATADAAVTASVATAGSPPTPPTPPSGTAAPNLPPDEFNALREYVRVVLPAEAKQVLTRAFNTPAANKLFREFFPEVIEQINDAQDGMTARIAAGYMLWKAGVDIGGPKTQDTLGRWKAKLLELFNLASSSDYAQRIMYDMAKGRVAQMKADRAKYDFRAYEARSRGNLQKAVNAIGGVKDKIFDPINRMLESNTQRAFESGIPSMRKIAGALYKPQGYAGEDRGMVRDAVHRTALFADRAVKIMAPLSDLQRRRVMDLLQRQASEAELTRASKSDPNKPAHSAKVQQAVREVRKLMDESLKYMRDAGVKVGQIDNFYPVQLDIRDDAVALKLQRLLERPHLEDAIRNLDQFAKRDKDGNKTPSEEPIADLITNLVDGARRTQRPAKTGAGAPNFTGANQRLMSFIYEVGTPQDIKDFAALQTKNPAESFSRYFEPMVKRAEYARRFGDDGNKLNAMLEKMKEEGAAPEQVQQAKNMVEAALGTYGSELSPVLNMISPALAKRFSGDKTRATIDGLQAYQNARLLPLALLSSLVDPAGIMVRAGGDAGIAWRGFRDGLKTLYNKSSREQMEDMLRMLGASSDMATQEALNQLFGGAGSKFSQKVNEVVFKWNGMSAWVRATRYMALTAGHEFLLNHGGRRTNEHSARYLEELGLKAGDIQPQIVKQPDGSERVLVALNTGDAARDARVRQALMDFVDGAVLRPNSQQSPQWHSDPFMGLVTQYKSFAYAFYDQIMGRIDTEMRNGNAKVLLAAAAYLPVVIMAEMLRNALQGDSEDTEDWGPDDWAMLGLERSGFVNPTLMAAKDTVGDVQHNRMPGTSQMGATPSQARNVLKAFDGQRDLGKEFESALPGSALWRKWNDGPRTAAGEA